MISSIKSIFLASLGISQFAYDRFKRILEGFIYKEGNTFYIKKTFKKKSAKKEVIKDLVERGEFLIDLAKLKGSEFRNRIVGDIEEFIKEFFDKKSNMKGKVKKFKDKKNEGFKRDKEKFLYRLNISV